MEEYTPDKAREEQRNLQEGLEKLLRRYRDLESKITDCYSHVQRVHSLYKKREADISDLVKRANKSLSDMKQILAQGRETLDRVLKDC